MFVDDNATKKLAKAEARVKKLEAEKEALLQQCQQHNAACEEHSLQKRYALQELRGLTIHVDALSNNLQNLEAKYDALGKQVIEVNDALADSKDKYQNLKRRVRMQV